MAFADGRLPVGRAEARGMDDDAVADDDDGGAGDAGVLALGVEPPIDGCEIGRAGRERRGG